MNHRRITIETMVMMISQSMSQKCRSPDRWQAYTEPHICKYLQDTWHNEEDNRGRYITYSQASSLIPHTNIVLFSISRRRIDNKALKYIQASRCPAVPMSRSLISMAGKYWICPCTPTRTRTLLHPHKRRADRRRWHRSAKHFVPKKKGEILYGHVIVFVWVINVCSDVGIRLLLLKAGFLLCSPLLGSDDARMMIWVQWQRNRKTNRVGMKSAAGKGS